MMPNEPRRHHVIPQFLLRNFALDPERLKVQTVAKQGNYAIWQERSIKSIGYESDFYVHLVGGRPVSVEMEINRSIETPISQSDTWKKIESDRGNALDRSDRAILYALVRHLEARTPHFFEIGRELTEMAQDKQHPMQFTDEEREMYKILRSNPDIEKAMHNAMTLQRFDEKEFDSAMVVVARSPVPFRTATVPVLITKVPHHPALHMPLPGMVPFQRSLVLNRRTIVTVVDGDFGGHFENVELDEEWAHGVNRSFAWHFAHFLHIPHLVSSRTRLIDDMTWVPYEVVKETPTKIVFRRRN
jgi:hypothetical protein